MGIFSRKKAEARSNIQDPKVPISNQAILEFFGLDAMSSAGVSVNLDNALEVPAVMAAVQFLSSTIAGLPLNVYKKTDQGREKQNGTLQSILRKAVNNECTSFDWLKYSMERGLTGGRSITYIERDARGQVVNLFPIDPSLIKVKRNGVRKSYVYKDGQQGEIVYQSNEILDINFGLKSDGLSAVSPILNASETIGLAIAATKYGAKFFNNGGVPPFVITGNFQSGKALERASEDLQKAIKKASRENRLALTLPNNHEIKSIGADPEKSQLVELKRFLIEEIARIYSLPPVFLQDLTHGTFSNTEQQDLHFVKHTCRRWVTQIEQELNLKLFGRENSEGLYVEFNLDGLLRGDFATRMSGYATGIQNGILKPNEARRKENMPDDERGDDLLIQGATVLLGSQPNIEGDEDE